MTALAITPAEAALGRADVAVALTGHRPLIDRKPAPRRAPKDHTTTLARRLERLARAALPQALQRLRREPGEVWLLANDPEAAVRIDKDRAAKSKKRTARARNEKLLPEFDARDPTDVSKVLANMVTRERRRVTAAGNASAIGASDGEVEIAASDLAAAPADLQLEAAQTLLALRAARLVDSAWHRVTALPATCGDTHDDAQALQVAEAAELVGCSRRTVQTAMRALNEMEDAGQLVLPCVPPVSEVYKARPRDSSGEEVTP